MSENSTHYELPPVSTKADESWRRVGFELEFSGIGLDETIAALQSVFSGEELERSAAECQLQVEGLGKFGIEIDWQLLKRLASDNNEAGITGGIVEQVSQAAALLVPIEIVCPPLPMNEISQLDPMVIALRNAGATGTEETPIAAYGVHINPEIPRLEADNLQAYIQAFGLLQWWLVDRHPVDMARRISPYIDLYPQGYVVRCLQREQASMDELIDDYLEFNATRNRALDLLPLLSMVDESRIADAVNDSRVNKRPTFHYRLPDCHIENPDWSLADAWNAWLVVERLASNATLLEEARQAFLDAQRPLLGTQRKNWVSWINQWLTDHALA